MLKRRVFAVALLAPWSFLLAPAMLASPSCKNVPAVLSADQIAIDLTNAICTPLEQTTTGQPYTDFACILVEAAEGVIAEIETVPDGGLVAAPSVKRVRVRVPTSEAPSFMAAHRAKAK